MDTPTLITSIASGASSIVSSMSSTISTLVTNTNVLTLVGLAVGYGIVKYCINLLPMIRRR